MIGDAKEEAMKILDTKLLLYQDSIVCEKSNIERNLSEFDFMGKHIQGLLTHDEYSTFIKELLNDEKIQDNGKKWKKALLFYKSEKQYEGKFIEAFKHENYHYYKISALSIDNKSQNWISWVNDAKSIAEDDFEMLSYGASMLRSMMYYSTFIPLRLYVNGVIILA